MTIDSALSGAAVLIVADRSEREEHLASMFAALGCVVHRLSSHGPVDIDAGYDAALIAARRGGGWTNGLITALRAPEVGCASVVLLELGNSNSIAQTLQAGAVDCQVSPCDRLDLLESVMVAIGCTERWRARVEGRWPELRAERARTLAQTRARVFEPQPQPQLESESPSTTERRLESVIERLTVNGRLTPREREVLHWLLQGHRYDDIATILGIAPRTAKFHASNLLRKLELDSRYELPRLLASET